MAGFVWYMGALKVKGLCFLPSPSSYQNSNPIH